MQFPIRLFAILGVALLTLSKNCLAEAQLSRHPYPQVATQNSVALLWRTVGGTIPIVRYGPSPEVLVNEVLPVQILVRLGPDVLGPPSSPRLHSAPPMTYQYEASIFGLSPGQTYYYAVYDGDTLLAGGDLEHSFTALPETVSTEPLRLWVVGDSGNGSQAQIAGFDAMRDFVAADGKPIDAYLHLGDMAYGIGLDTEFSANFFNIYTDLLRNTVCWPTMGNHEGISSSGLTQKGPYYDSYAVPTQGEAGGLASGTEAYYSFDIGRVHFVCLDSHDLDRSPTGDMALWLKADLEMANADWLIAFWHHPPYTKGSHDSDRESQLIQMREFIMPILESHGVDLVLGGHSHIYERSMLIDGAYATPTTADGVVLDDGDGRPGGHGAYRKSAALNPNEGTVAVVAGHGRSARSSFGLSPIMRSTIGEVGSVIIDIDGDTLTGKMINSEGIVRDEFQLVKQGDVEPAIVDFPWQPHGPEFRMERPFPGQDIAEIYPVPAAPDAVIYYTLDGSDPTSDSTTYTGPVALGSGEILKAMSVWRGGERQSLISEAPVLREHISLQTFLETGADDGVQDALGEIALAGESILLGGQGVAGFRFGSVQIPEDAFIIRAQMQFYKAASNFLTSDGEFWGELSPNSPPFSGVAQEFTTRARTSNVAPWRPPLWTTPIRDFQSETSDLGPILQEVVSLPGWEQGNAVSFFVTQSGERLAGAIESGSAKAASLFVTYILTDGLVERIADQPLEIFVRPDGLTDLRFESPVLQAVAGLGLIYEIEGSSDLVDWVGLEPAAVFFGFNGLGGFTTVTARMAPDVLQGQDQSYFRLKVSMDEPNP